MTVIVVQGFFAIRAWKVTNRNWVILGMIAVFALTAFGGGIGVKVMFMQVGSTLRAGDVKVPAYIWLFGTVAADLIITGIILFYLITSRKTTSQKATDDVITRLARVTFESQLPPTLIAVGLAIEYTIQYSSFIAIPFLCVQAKFYGISLLHTLNSYVAVFGWLFGSLRFEHMSFRREALKNVGSTMATDDALSKHLLAKLKVHASRWTSGNKRRHPPAHQFTIMPEPRTRRVKAESIDTVSFKGVDLGDDDESRNNLGEEINVVDLDDIETPPRRPARGGEFKLASMGLAGGMSSVDTGR
ncbi:hypothetical protein RHS01_05688 [Rhizoctonia solani]|uniref:DUF6534 domain-containing protein n=1 Tax=Rhizoctonia solani TaxID=456999 RepID=A0A8H7M4T8_9AGAM|nr:hypothetical protein RHS01_05688 [Rhizoctonia solani]